MQRSTGRLPLTGELSSSATEYYAVRNLQLIVNVSPDTYCLGIVYIGYS